MQYLLIISHDADFQPTESLVGDILAWIGRSLGVEGARSAGDLADALSAHAAGWQGDSPRNPIHSLSEHEGPLRWRIKNYVANKRRSTK